MVVYQRASLQEAVMLSTRNDKVTAYYMINWLRIPHFRARSQPTSRGSRVCRASAPMPQAQPYRAQRNTKRRGNPRELGAQYAICCDGIHINVLGGCCGTDHRHIEEIARL
jgi:S-methylmethionine-dependent homocysteine/selenocysteine methylase